MKKTYFKKTISLIMTIVMLMSCWVFVAPQKAEAANGGYYVRVYVRVYDDADNNFGNPYKPEYDSSGVPKTTLTSMAGFTLYCKSENGRGAVEEHPIDLQYELKNARSGSNKKISDVTESNWAEDENSGSNYTLKEYPFSGVGFPTEVRWILDDNEWLNDATGMAISKITVAKDKNSTQTVIWKGLSGGETRTARKYGSIKPSGCTVGASDGVTGDAANYVKKITKSKSSDWLFPYVKEGTNVESATAVADIGIPPLGDNKDVSISSRSIQYYALDNYGVRYEPTSYSVSGVSGLTTGSGWALGKAYTITATQSTTQSTDSIYQNATVTMNWNNGQSTTGQLANTIADFKVYNSRHKVTFNGNGGTLGTNYTYVYYGRPINDETSTATSNNVAELETELFPTKGIRDGYTFAGIFTTADGGAEVTADQIINGDVTYYAHWNVGKFNVIFKGTKLNGAGTDVMDYILSEESLDYGVMPVPPQVPDYDFGDNHYTFAGWDKEVVPVGSADIVYEATYNAEFVPADYSAYNAIRAEAQAIINSANYDAIYSQESRDRLEAALDMEVADNLGRTKQGLIDAYVQTLRAAIDGLGRQKYSVIFIDGVDSSIIEVRYPVYYGDAITTSDAPERGFTSTHHYVFDKWEPSEEGDDISFVSKNMVIVASYNEIEHEYTTQELPSNCTTQSGVKYTCSCGYSYIEYSGSVGTEHNLESEWTVDIKPTCISEGSKSHHCTRCSYRADVTEISALGHDFTGGYQGVVVSPSCEDDGVEASECQLCGYTKYTLISASGHNWSENVVAPTCTSSGYTVKTCANCHDEDIVSFVDPIAHTYVQDESKYVDPTCTGLGKIVSYCSCGAEKVETISATGHEWESETTVDFEATCISNGQRSIHCSVCDVIDTDTITEIVSNGHTWKEEETIQVKTCESKGLYIETCSICQSNRTREEAALGHKYNTVTTPATCTQAGMVVETCENCGDVNTTVTPASGHTYNAVHSDASCNKIGFTTYTCDCGYSYVEFDNGAETTGHNFDKTIEANVTVINPTCTVEGYKTIKCANAGCTVTTTEVISAIGHDMKAGTKVPATCTTSGYTPYTCANADCDHTYNVYDADAPAKVHVTWTETGRTNATCTTDGSVSYKCAECTATKTEVLPKLGHNYVKQGETTAATCTNPSTEVYKCANTGCGDTYTKYLAASTAHTWGDFVTVKEPTETESGLELAKCTKCDAEKTQTIAPIGNHVYTAEITEPATCTKDGVKTYTCSVHSNCSYTEVIRALGHKEKLVYVAPTCTSEGSTKIICDTCKIDLAEEQKIPMLAHTYGTGTKTTAPTCTDNGVMTYTCTANGCGAQRTEVIPRTGHTLSSQYSAATCTSDGFVTTSCSKCNYSTTQELPAMGHKLTVTVKDATCSEAGSVTEECLRCGDKNTTEIKIKNHLYNGTETIIKNATCTENGEKTIKCATCAVVTTVVIPMTGHKWGEYKTTSATCTTDGKKVAECDNCNAEDVIVLPKLGHSYGDWEVVKEATNSEDGKWERKCANCKDVETIVIPAGGHKFEGTPEVTKTATCKETGTAVYKCSAHIGDNACGVTLTVTVPLAQHTVTTRKTPATCTTTGSVEAYCTVCSAVFSTETTEKLPHTYVAQPAVAATCTTSGYTTMKCACGDSYDVYNADAKATGHKLVEGTSTASCTGEGLMTLTCGNVGCSYSTTVKVPALGHNYNEVSTTSATCAAAATKTYKCSRCEASYTISEGEKSTAHSFGAWEVKKSATESSIGYKTRTCGTCQLVDFEIIDALGEHVFKEFSRTEPTCTEKGEINYVCDTHKDCGKTDKVEIPANGHTQTLVYTAANCENAGSTKIVCSVESCKAVIDSKDIPALGHLYGEGVVTPSTCETAGTIVYICTRPNCGGTHTVTLGTNANAHQYATTVNEATCTVDGSVVTKCTLCGDVTLEKALAAKGHYFAGTETSKTAPTCETDGEKYVKCKFCNDTTIVPVPKLGHSFSNWSKTDATNDTDGSWTRKCATCGKEEVLVIPAGGHKFEGAPEVTKIATCKETGTEVYKCSAHTGDKACGVTITVTVPVAQHEIKLVTEKATCTKEGKITVACENCTKDFGIEATLPIKAHSFDNGTVVAPTCTTSGYTTYECACGYAYNKYDESKPATGHTFDDTIEANVTIEEATCTEAGTKTVKCKDCNVKNVTALPKTEHSYTETAKAATCTTAGTKTYTCECGYSYVEFTSEANGHTFGDWTEIQAPTTDKYGIKKRVCTVCNKAEELAMVAPIGDHEFKVEETKSATCTEPGTKVYTCTNHTDCQANYSETLPALGHKQTLKYSAATCEAKGSTKIVCSVEDCEAVIDSKGIPALGHDWTQRSITNATCVAAGKIEYECSRDNCNATKETVIPVDGTAHDYEVKTTQPTCTKEGSVVVKCDRDGCSAVLVDQTLPMTEHTWGTPVVENATCENDGSKLYNCTADGCDATKTEVIDELGHDWSDWKVVASTNSEPGSVSRKCNREGCDAAESIVIPAGGHNLVGTTIEEVSCTKTGKVKYDCDVHTGDADCGIELTITLDKLQHELETSKTDASCTKEGSVVTKCKNCNTATITTVIPATGHTYDAGKTTPATCTSTGKIVYSCTAEGCKETREVTLEKKQHNYVAGNPVAATCTSSGYTPYKCKDCGSSYVIITAPANGHTYSEQVSSSADCTNGGTMTLKCACGDTMTTTVPALGHNYEKKSETSATCKDAATETYKCSACDASYTVSVGSKTTTHTWNEWVTVEPTYTSIGYKTRTCKVCDKLEIVHIEAIGDHKFVDGAVIAEQSKAATCTEDGYEVRKCSVHTGEKDCGKTETFTLPKTGHTEIIDYQAATCTAEGHANIYCTTCKKTLKSQTIAELGHIWGNEEITLSDCTDAGKVEFTCTRSGCTAKHKVDLPVNENAHTLKTTVNAATCKDKGSVVLSCEKCNDTLKTTELPLVPHAWGEWKVTKAATNANTGIMTRTCANSCTETAEIPAGGHTFGQNPDSIDAATCTKTGTATYKCTAHTDCGVAITVTLAVVQHTLETETDEATCTKEGFVKVYCAAEDCDYVAVDVTTGKIAHVFAQVGETVAPTCTSSGYKTMKCENCNETYNEIGEAALAHDYKEVENSSTATCTKAGTKTLKCSRCDNEMTVNVPALGHDYKKVDSLSTDATCKDEATETYKCSRCDASYTISVGEKSEIHKYPDAWTVVKPATDKSIGYQQRECSVCGQLEVQTIEATGEHKFTTGVIVESSGATCTADGYEIRKCTTHPDCGETARIVLAKLGHIEKLDYKAADCDDTGYANIICERCTEVLVEQSIPALGCLWVTGEIVAPTCSTEGTIEYKCSRCNSTKTEKLDKVDHDYITTTTDAKCEKEGSVVITCKHCDYKETTILAAKAHSWKDEPKSTVAATCETDGSATYECKNCDKQNTVVVPKLGHKYEAVETKEATCLTSGYTTYECKNDASHTYKAYDALKPAKGHTFGAWEVVTPATQTTEGLKTRTCVCGVTEEETIPAMMHNMVVVENECSDSTCTAEGKVVYKCTTAHDGVNCNYTLTVTTAKIAHTLKTVVTDAKCETAGSVVTSCEKCDTVNETTVLPALGHKYVGSVTTNATCTADGVMTYVCQNDNRHTYTQAIPATGHNYSAVLTAPTCEAKGYTTYTCGCSATYKDNYVDALGHSYSDWTDTGSDETHSRICSRCDSVLTQAHKWDDGKVTVAPSYDNEGQTLYTCLICNATKTEGIEVDVDKLAPTGSIKWNATLWNDFLNVITFGTYVNYDVVLEITAKDNETGVKNIEYYVSDKALTLDEVKALADWSAYDSLNKLTVSVVDAAKVVVYAKITDNAGNEIYLSTDGIVFDTTAPVLSIEADEGDAQTNVYCSGVTVVIDDANIGYAIYDGKTIALSSDKFYCNEIGKHTVTVFDKAGNSSSVSFTVNDGHTFTNAPAADNSNLKDAATCETKAAYYTACSVCGKIGNETFEYGDKLGHDYVGVVTTPATCETDGVKTYTCQNDNSHTYTEAVAATGHKELPAKQENRVEAKCEKTGSYDMVVYCANCGKLLSRTKHTIPAKDHNYVGTVTTLPTCTETGVKTYVCTNDATHAYSEILPANGHTDENNDCTCEVCGNKCCTDEHLYVEVLSAPTCTKKGYTVRKCTNCDREDKREIAALGHNTVKTSVNATCSEYAHDIITCTRCDELNEKVYTGIEFAKHTVVIIPGKEATCVSDGYTSYERCTGCGMVTESQVIYKESIPHVNENGDTKCDNCGGEFYTENLACSCLCHGTGIKAFLYKIALIFWKLFKMSKSCACGNVHY